MAYIGRQLARGENKLFDDISSGFNGSTTTFTLAVSSVATATATPYQLFVSLGGVMQKPNTDFTTAGNQITFTTAPAAGLSCWIMMQGDTIDQAAIPDSSVTPSKISGSNFAFSGDLRLKDADGSHYVGFASPSTVSTNKVWTLPAADGSASQYLQTNGSGVLTWATVSIGGATGIDFNDNVKARYGTGNDLEVFHNGSHSVINDAGTGDLLLQVGGSTKATVSSTGLGVTGALTVSTNATITGNLTVNGTTTTVDSVTLSVKDKNIEMGVVSSPSDTTADGGGITLKGAADKTFNWVNSTDAWTSSEHIHLGDNKKLIVGTGQDLSLYHDGTNSYIDNREGNLVLMANTTDVGIKIIPDASCELYENNVKRAETTTTGFNVIGSLLVDGSPLATGNTFTAVANGAIANNKAVKIDTDGKVSQIASTSVRATSPTRSGGVGTAGISVSNASENAEDVKCTWIGNNKMLVTWIKDNYPSSGKQGVKGVVGTWDSTAEYFTNWGSEFQMCANTRRARYDVDWDATNDTILFSYVDVDDNTKGKTAFVKVSGTTLSFISSGQTPRVWRNSSDTRSVRTTWDDNIERLVLMYQAGNNQGVHSVVMQKNSSDDSYAYTYAGSESSNNPVADDDCAICSLTSGKAIAFWNSTDGNFYYMIGVVNTSNNTISWGSKVQAKGDEQMYCDCAYNSDKSIVMFVGRHTGGFNRCTPHFTEFNNSNNTLGSWSAVYMDNDQSESHSCVYDPDSEAFHIAFLLGSSPNSMRHRSIYHSSTTASSYSTTNALEALGTQSSGDYSWTTRMAAAPGLGIISFAAYGNTYTRVYTQNVKTTTSQSNLTNGQHYVGYADQAYTNGQTATIKTVGNVAETLSGLTAGTKYYVQGDGTLATSAGSPSCLAGLALSSSKLLIREGKSDV